MTEVLCDYCGKPAVLTTGSHIYYNRSDLSNKMFWRCYPCKAYVGCHPKSKWFPSGTVPLGRLANAELRAAKNAAHAAFDPIWREGLLNRHEAYRWLAEKMSLSSEKAHIGMFDVEQCRRVVQYANEYLHNLKSD